MAVALSNWMQVRWPRSWEVQCWSETRLPATTKSLISRASRTLPHQNRLASVVSSEFGSGGPGIHPKWKNLGQGFVQDQAQVLQVVSSSANFWRFYRPSEPLHGLIDLGWQSVDELFLQPNCSWSGILSRYPKIGIAWETHRARLAGQREKQQIGTVACPLKIAASVDMEGGN